MDDAARRHHLTFGLELQKVLVNRAIGANDLMRALTRHGFRPEQSVDAILTGRQTPTPALINMIVRALELTMPERLILHRAAAIDRGFEIGPLREDAQGSC